MAATYQGLVDNITRIMGSPDMDAGAKQAAILEAEARLEASKRDANARVMLAEASAEAIRRVAAAVGTDTTPMLYMLGEKYIASLERMGSTDNAKVVVLPADLQEAVRGLFVGKR